jgi:hypothetical protein
MSQLKNTIRRVSAIKGIFLGIVLLVVNILSYYLLISTTGNAWVIVFSPVIFSVAIPIIAVLIFCFYLRKSIGGYWVYRQAVTGIFIMFVVCYAIQVVGKDVIFAKVVEPDMINKTQTAMLNATNVMLKKSGANQAAIDKKKAEIQKQMDDQKNITVGAIIQGYVITLLFLFLFALIFATLFRKNPPGVSS